MTATLRIILELFVRTFYRENAGAFIFLLTIMFGVVGQVDGAGIVAYHYSLIVGMLSNPGFFLLVAFLWLLYARKCIAFVTTAIRKKEYSFLHILRLKGKSYIFQLFCIVQFLLYLPVLSYAVLIITVSFIHHWWIRAAAIILLLLLICILSAIRYTQLLTNPEKQYYSKITISGSDTLKSYYPFVLMRFVFNKYLVMFTGIKLYTCGVLYLMVRNNTASDYDIQFPFVLFSFGVFANLMIIYRVREFEEIRLSFYRGFPVSLVERQVQYLLFCFILFFCELVTITWMTPIHLHYIDAIRFILAGFSILLFLHSLTFTARFSMKEYLKICFLVFTFVMFLVAAEQYEAIYLIFFPTALILFFRGYSIYQHEIN